MIALGMAPGAHVDGFAFEHLRGIDAGALTRIQDGEGRPDASQTEAKIGACDLTDLSLRGMRANFAAQGVSDRIESWKGDAGGLDHVDVGSYPLIVTNPPYAIRVGNPRAIRALYGRFAKAAMDKGVERLVVTTPRSAWIVESLQQAGFRIGEARRILYGALPSTVIVANS